MAYGELTEDVWTAVQADVTPGDICIAPHPALAGEPLIISMPDTHDGFALTTAIAYGLVISQYSAGVSFVPVTTGELFNEPEQLEQLAERATSPSPLLRLPPLGGEWEGPAVAFLALPQTVNAALVGDKRIASMSDDGRAVVRRRFVNAYAHEL